MKPLLSLALGLLAGPIVIAAADPAARQSEAYQASVAQDGLKRDAATIRAELVRVRDQMREFLPDDAATVDLAIRQLDSLSKEEMERVIQALRGASRPEALTGQARALADALRDQGSISTGLKKLAVNLDARQSMEGLAGEVSALLQRQVAARDELARLGRREGSPERLHGHDHERWEAVNEDQRRVSEDIKLLTPRLERLAAALSGGGQERFARAVAVARDGKLNDLADRAALGTAQGPFAQATETQGIVTTLLVSMEQTLDDAARPADRLAALRDKLKETLAHQQEVTGTIAGFHERQSVEDETKRLQTALSDQVARLHAELAPLNSQAAAELQTAQDATESASKHYDRMWEERPEAQQATRDASARLETALQDVDKQIAALPGRTPATPAQLDAALVALQRDTAQAAAAAQREATPGTIPPNPADQQALQKQVDDLQQRALPISPDAAQALNEAAADLRKTDPASQQAAAQQLNKAQQELARQQAALEGRAPGQQALAQAEANVAQAQQALAQPQADLGSDKTAAQAVNEFNAARQQIANAQKAAAQAGAPAEAQAALAEAARDINQAQTDAATLKLDQAQGDTKAGQQALAQAAQGMAAARQAQTQQAAASLPSKAGHDPGQLQNGNANQGQGNGGGGKSGDSLAGAGEAGKPPAPISGLSTQDRAAVVQLQSQKPPADYASDVEQYYKNIADGTGL